MSGGVDLEPIEKHAGLDGTVTAHFLGVKPVSDPKSDPRLNSAESAVVRYPRDVKNRTTRPRTCVSELEELTVAMSSMIGICVLLSESP